MTKLVFLTCLASTLFMTGLIWFVQVVHYPLFDRVDPDSFRRYHADHTIATGFVVILPHDPGTDHQRLPGRPETRGDRPLDGLGRPGSSPSQPGRRPFSCRSRRIIVWPSASTPTPTARCW